jgi:acyl-CoA thioesterase-1
MNVNQPISGKLGACQTAQLPCSFFQNLFQKLLLFFAIASSIQQAILQPMVKKIALAAGIVILMLVFAEIIRLVQLKGSIARYSQYWKQQANNQGEFTYVAIGDSAAQGIGASRPDLGYVGLLAKQIQQSTGKSVRVVNLSVTGAKISDVINGQIPKLQDYKPALITVEIGSNDVANRFSAQKFQAQYEQMISLLPKNTVVANIPYFGGRLRHNAKAIEASKIINQAAQKKSLKMVDLQKETRQKQSVFNYAADYFHPSNRGYRIWYDAFWQTIERIITPKR